VFIRTTLSNPWNFGGINQVFNLFLKENGVQKGCFRQILFGKVFSYFLQVFYTLLFAVQPLLNTNILWISQSKCIILLPKVSLYLQIPSTVPMQSHNNLFYDFKPYLLKITSNIRLIRGWFNFSFERRLLVIKRFTCLGIINYRLSYSPKWVIISDDSLSACVFENLLKRIQITKIFHDNRVMLHLMFHNYILIVYKKAWLPFRYPDFIIFSYF
jgi:hypothetical protein